MAFKKLLIFLLFTLHSFAIFAQKVSNPYREFVEKELAKSLEDTAISPSRYIYKMGGMNVDTYSEVKIFPKMIRRNNLLDEENYKNIIYKNNYVGVLWSAYFGVDLTNKKYKLLVITLNEDIFYAKTYSNDTTVAIIPLTEKMKSSNYFIVKTCLYTSDDETDE